MSKKEAAAPKPKRVPKDAHEIASMAAEVTSVPSLVPQGVDVAAPSGPPMPPQVKKQVQEKLGLTLHGLEGPNPGLATAAGSGGGGAPKPPVAPSAPPPPPLAKAPAGAASAAPRSAEDPVARAICLRQLKRYGAEYRERLGSFIPSNYGSLSLQQLQDLVAGCDGMLSEGSEFAVLSSGVLMSLSFYERALMPWLPRELPHAHAHGVAGTAAAAMQNPSDPLYDALNRLSIKYTGMLETGPWGALFVSMHQLIAMQGEYNLKRAGGFATAADQAEIQEFDMP